MNCQDNPVLLHRETSRNHAMRGSDKLEDLLGGVFAHVGKTVQRHKGKGVAGEKTGG